MPIALALALLAVLAAERVPEPTPAPTQIVFVCEHGSVKSVIAMAWFERLARKRGLDVRAISRGMTPDAAVPTAIADRLRQDGFELGAFQPGGFSKQDLEGARRVVAIGVDTAAVTATSSVPVEVWDDIPPATQHYDEARDALRARIEALLATLHE
jgi:protein-tyrosine-phosphatase